MTETQSDHLRALITHLAKLQLDAERAWAEIQALLQSSTVGRAPRKPRAAVKRPRKPRAAAKKVEPVAARPKRVARRSTGQPSIASTVLRGFAELGPHPSDDQLFAFVAETRPTLNRATFRSTLHRLKTRGTLTQDNSAGPYRLAATPSAPEPDVPA